MKSEMKNDKAAYIVPEMRSVSEAEVLDELGPARAYTGTFPFGF
jgi:hypothetical protein